MDSSRRAVEAYWRSRMVEGVTADEAKVAAVYKLEEICELLRTSHPSIVKEVADYILKRLDHKSPVVKQKALRLIKYAVGKSGAEFRREMQRHSVAMRQLFHYKGLPDPLKGDSLNKAVRDTAHEAVSAVFDSDDGKVSSAASAGARPVQGLSKRIEGFGSTNFDMPMEEKRSFISEVVGLGSASIKQGLNTIATANSSRKADSGSYKSPTLHRSLTTEMGGRDYDGDSRQRESSVSSGTWSADMHASVGTGEEGNSAPRGVKSREERLLDTIVTSGGVRLQPAREAIQAFLAEALKLDAVSMSHAIEVKLQSHLWQARMKAICVLEAILRKKDDDHFCIISSYFSENRDSVVKCSELPQVSLREKASKVLRLLEGDGASEAKRHAEESPNAKEIAVPVQVPDLIDTGDPDDYESETSDHKQIDQSIGDLMSSSSLADHLFGSGNIDGQTTAANVGESDPFSDVSFHVSEDKGHEDIFSGLTVDDRRHDVDISAPQSELADVFGDNTVHHGKDSDERNMENLISGLYLNETAQPGYSGGIFSGATLEGNDRPGQLPPNALLGSNTLYPFASMQYNLPHNMFNQAFASQPMNYGAMGAFITQQQLLYQSPGSFNSGFAHPTGNVKEVDPSSALPDIFNFSNNPVQSQGTAMNNPKKEDTRAFDFIADHLSAGRDFKRVL